MSAVNIRTQVLRAAVAASVALSLVAYLLWKYSLLSHGLQNSLTGYALVAAAISFGLVGATYAVFAIGLALRYRENFSNNESRVIRRLGSGSSALLLIMQDGKFWFVRDKAAPESGQ